MQILKKIRYRLTWHRNGRLNKRQEGLIQIEMLQGNKRIYVSTKTYVKKGQFANGMVVNRTNADKLNFYLFSLIDEIETIELQMIYNGTDYTAASVREAYRKHAAPSATIREFGTETVSVSDRKKNTKQNYATLFNSIDKFKKNVALSDIDFDFVSNYTKWLEKQGVSHNTIVSRQRMLRAILNEAKARGIISSNPFDRFRIKGMTAKKGYISSEQLSELEKLELKGDEETVRDAFLIGCYTGLRFSDVKELSSSNLQDGWIVTTMKKTGGTVEVPYKALFDGKAYKLFEKYDGKPEKLTSRIGGNASVNRILHAVLDRVGADRKITFHSSRHTFATLLGQAGVDIATVSKLLGHKKLQTTEIYREVDRRSVGIEMEKAFGKQTSV